MPTRLEDLRYIFFSSFICPEIRKALKELRGTIEKQKENNIVEYHVNRHLSTISV